MAIDPVLGAIGGKILDGVIGSIGGGSKRPRAQDAVKYLIGKKRDAKGRLISWSRAQAMHEDEMLRGRFATAKSLGIHPLHMLGVSSSGSPQVPTMSDGGTDLSSFAGAGTDIARAISAGQSGMERLQMRLLEAQIEGQEIDNVARASQVATLGQPGTGPSGLPGNLEKVAASSGNFPLHAVGYDEHGNQFRFFNSQDIGDSEVAQLAHFFRYTVPDYIKGGFKNAWRGIVKPKDDRWFPSYTYDAINRFRGR